VSTFRQPGTVLTDHTFLVPLDHSRPEGEQIEVYGREVVAVGKADGADSLPWLVFLQGGPGFPAQRPVGRQFWLDRALDDYRVLLLDQRGTGRSSKISARSLATLGPAAKQAEYLTHFRADSIVLDAELIRRELTGGEPWSVLGQSFGGFCTTTYLSFAPHGMREALITGGLPGLEARAEDVYRITYQTCAARSAAHYERYPDDIDVARRVAEYLADRDDGVPLPNGARLTVEAFQSIGGMLGSTAGSHELHYLLEDPFDADGGLSDIFLSELATRTGFTIAPLYAVLHEACYAQGAATEWAAQRVREEFPEFDAAAALDSGAPVLFTGEMIYPWMMDVDPALRPLRMVAEILATRDGWPPLYDPARLAANDVPGAAAVYYHDMYVPRELSMSTAAAIRGMRPWVTSEYQHDGLRVSGGRVLDRLIAMNRGEV
jgi:pimeloyl-ACP methyl ester carboxylesterase